jgi:hypothetical protein
VLPGWSCEATEWYNSPMPSPRFQFRLSTLFWVVTASALCAGILRVFWGTEALILGFSAGTSVAGFACVAYGARMMVATGSTWAWLLAVVGFFLIFAGLCGGCVHVVGD